MKKCSKCKKIKPNDAFYAISSENNRLRNQCKDCHNQKRRNFYQKHVQMMRDRGKKYRDNNREKRAALQRKYMQTIQGKFSAYKRRAQHNKLLFTLTQNEFSGIVSQPCYYCGELQENFNGIDRFNNKEGYTVDNSVPCCTMCNMMKHTQHADEFIKKCNEITEKNKIRNNEGDK